MNKMIKGSMVGATGVALLMGGFGTYALWSDSSALPASSVSSGELDIAAGDVHWNDLATAGNDDWTAGTDKMVPGDTVTRTQTFAIKGNGKNLAGVVDFTQGGVTGNTNGFKVKVEVSSDNAKVVAGAGNDFTFSSPFDTATLTAVVTYTLDSSVSNQVDQNATVALAESTLQIRQGS
jgi:alternate signal-mediated exported protein